MGFLDKIKKVMDSKEERDSHKDPEPAINFNKTHSFSDLDNLIHSGKKEIVLDNDVILTDAESPLFPTGIIFDVDGITINGNGHAIDARNKTRFFKILSNNITFKNIRFENGYTSESGGGFFSNGNQIKFLNCEFSNLNANAGGAIANYPNYDMEIQDCIFHDNKAQEYGGVIFNGGTIRITDSKFINNAAKEGGVINSQIMSKIEISNCEFISNKSDGAGAIFSAGTIDIEKSLFEDNYSSLSGGAFVGGGGGSFEISSSKFINNRALTKGGAFFVGMCELKLTDSELIGNSSNKGGTIYNMGYSNIGECLFKNNNCEKNGGAIYNSEELKLTNSELENNEGNIGGALYNSKKIIASNINVINNSSKAGGAIFNETGEATISDSVISKNKSYISSAIFNARESSLTIDNVEFSDNPTDESVIRNYGSEFKIISCKFSSHKAEKSIIFNEHSSSMTVMDSTFENNGSESLISNNDDSTISVSDSTFSDNTSRISAISNCGKSCIIDGVTFDNNRSDRESGEDIYNESLLTLTNPKFKNENQNEIILNKGHIDIKKVKKEDIDDRIHNLGTIDYLIKDSDSNGFNFTYLDELIQNTDGTVTLTEDILMDGSELDFYEGGIELSRDNLIIEGNGRTIDANSKSRIFIITGENITLKNIVFKNAFLTNEYDIHTSGGGAVRITKGSSLKLENCKFIDNTCQDDGGAILNNGMLESDSSMFENNDCEMFGGAVCNNNIYISKNDEFSKNKSKIAGAIYNCANLNIDGISLSDNRSNIEYPIFNNDNIHTSDEYLDAIYNLGNINCENTDGHSFTHLNGLIMDNEKIILDKDIIYDYNIDSKLKNGISLSKEMTIDGNGFSIDGRNMASFFKISENVTFKNITFKNAFSNETSIFTNKANVEFENCRFINNKVTKRHNLIENDKRVRFIDSVFSNNSTKCGSIIHNNHLAEINGCDFLINNTGRGFGIIYNFKHAILNDSTFNTNHSKDYIVGSSDDSKLEINNNKFNNNILNGTVLVNLGECELKNSLFKENISVFSCSCIFSSNKTVYETSKLIIDNTSFIKNEGGFISGTIYNIGKADISNSKFKENNSKENAGAIKNGGHLKIFNSDFADNISSESGGAIHNDGSLEINHCEFYNNDCERLGKSIYSSVGDSLAAISPNLKINNTDFIDNNAEPNEIIYSTNENDAKIVNCNFKRA